MYGKKKKRKFSHNEKKKKAFFCNWTNPIICHKRKWQIFGQKSIFFFLLVQKTNIGNSLKSIPILNLRLFSHGQNCVAVLQQQKKEKKKKRLSMFLKKIKQDNKKFCFVCFVFVLKRATHHAISSERKIELSFEKKVFSYCQTDKKMREDRKRKRTIVFLTASDVDVFFKKRRTHDAAEIIRRKKSLATFLFLLLLFWPVNQIHTWSREAILKGLKVAGKRIRMNLFSVCANASKQASKHVGLSSIKKVKKKPLFKPTLQYWREGVKRDFCS